MRHQVINAQLLRQARAALDAEGTDVRHRKPHPAVAVEKPRGEPVMTKTLRRILLSAGLSTGLLAAAAGAATTHPILAGLSMNHCQPLVHRR
jgi:hypothetical protein